MTKSYRTSQLELRMYRHGGKREGAGRRRTSRLVTHTVRPTFNGKTQPLHVTLRMAPHVWNLRSERGFGCVRKALAHERKRGDLRIVHFSVQGNHLHLVVEAPDSSMLSRRMQGFGIRLARALNKMMGGRRGRVLGDRYHARALKSAREVQRVIRYVLLNHHIHAARDGRVAPIFDRFSSAHWFPPFAHHGAALGIGPPPLREADGDEDEVPPVSEPESWALAIGWRRHGPVDVPAQPTLVQRPRS